MIKTEKIWQIRGYNIKLVCANNKLETQKLFNAKDKNAELYWKMLIGFGLLLFFFMLSND